MLIQRQSGVSLPELLISLTIGLILLIGVTRLATEISRTDTAIMERGDELEQARYTLELIKKDLKLAGFYGMLYRLPTPPTSLPDPCSAQVSSLVAGLALPLQGYDKPQTQLSCTTGASKGIDRLVIRRAGTQGFVLDEGADDDDGDGDSDDLDYGKAYIQAYEDRFTLGYCSRAGQCTGLSNCQTTGCLDRVPGGQVRTVSGSELAVFGMKYRSNSLPVMVFPYFVHLYYIRSWSSITTDGIPTLVRAELTDYGTAPKIVANPLMEGVENMSFQYGIDSSEPADNQIDYYTPAPTTLTEWARVRTVKVYLLVRGINKAQISIPDRAYDMGDSVPVVPAPEDRDYRHHWFTTVIRLDNTLNRTLQ